MWMRTLALRSFRRCYSTTTALQDQPTDFFQRVLRRFPGNRNFVYAYGSGVYLQEGHKSMKDNMVDFILAVNDPVEWHRENLERNPSDYSGLLSRLGPTVISEVQEKWGAKLYFNTLIPFEQGQIKYGVISREAMIADLLDWENLYASGRLHKPVKILEKSRQDEDMHLALRMNLTSAMHTALLLLPETFTEEQLYMTLAGLSYTGDFRMVVGEDKKKVANIVRPHIPAFRSLYTTRLKALSDFLDVSDGNGEQDVSPGGRHYHLTMLPRNLQWHLVREWNRDGRWRDVEDVLRAAAFDRDSDEYISAGVSRIVRRTSVTQAVKGIFSAGAVKTVKYSGAKLKKMFKSMK